MNTIKVYVSTYEQYNNGSLSGKWVDLSDYSDADEFVAAMQAIYGEDAELMYPDHEDDFGLSKSYLSESHINPLVWDLLQLEEHAQESVSAMLYNGSELRYALDNYNDVISYADWDELVEQFTEGCPEHLQAYLDEDKIVRDLEHDGYFEYNGSIYLVP